MESLGKNNIFIKIIKGVGISIIFTLISLTIFSALLTYTNLSEGLIQPVVISVTGISIFVGSFFVTRKIKKNGIIKGIVVGLIYIMLIYLISSVVNNAKFSLNLGSIVMISIGILCGAIGGIIGVNMWVNLKMEYFFTHKILCIETNLILKYFAFIIVLFGVKYTLVDSDDKIYSK